MYEELHQSHRRVSFEGEKTMILYDRLAPANVSTLQTPFLVLILCTLLVSGSIQAASRVSRVQNPWEKKKAIEKNKR